MSDSSQIKHDSVAQDDPFAELLRLTEEAAPEVDEAAIEEIPDDVQVFDASAEEAASPVTTIEMPADLEEALLAELGVEPEPEAVIGSSATNESDDALGEALTEPTPVEPPALDDEFVAPEAEMVPELVEPTQPSLEDELAALLGNEDAGTPFDEPDLPVHEPAAQTTLSDQEARALMETALADDAFIEQDLAEDTTEFAASDAATPEIIDANSAQVDLEEAIAAEISQSMPVDPDQLDTGLVLDEGAIAEADDLDIDALFENALADENIFDDFSEDASQQAGESVVAIEPADAETDPLDELLGIMGDEPVQPPSTFVEEPVAEASEFAGEPETLAMAPALETQEIDLEDDLDLSDFDLGVAGVEGQSEATATHQETGEETYVVGSTAATGVGMAEQGLDLSLDDAFDEVRFEAELARDMEFVAHDAQARSGDEFADMETDLEADLSMSEFEPEPEAKSQRGLKIAAIVGSIAVAGALGLFLFAGGSGQDTAGPVVVEADPEPIKVRPENPGGTEVPNQDSAVFAGNDGANAPPQPSLVATSEEPVDLAGLPTGEAPKSEDRLLPEASSDNAISGLPAEEGAVTPRRVRTLVVRPDGTLEERPIEEPAVEIAAVEPAESVVEPAPSEVAVEPVGTTLPAEGTQVGTDSGVVFQPPAVETERPVNEVPVRRVQTQVVSPNGIPSRPAEQPINVINDQAASQQVAAAPAQTEVPAPAPVPVPQPAAAASDGFKVQIASLPSQAQAQQTSANLLSRFRNVLGGRGVAIREAQIPDRGTFYRVQVDASSLDDANSLCAQYKAAGGDCIVVR
ncbi:MAG: SPOR domain-containing protein [Pseudomonadota bacterium]